MFKVFAFTGHRPDKLGGYSTTGNETYEFVRNWLYYEIHSLIRKYRKVDFISGGALGVDQIAAEIVLEAKRAYVAEQDVIVRLTLALPCREHDSKWPTHSKMVWRDIIRQSDNVTYIHDGPYPGAWCLQKRNEWMVQQCEGLIAVYDGSEGGTRNCMLYAWRNGYPIMQLNPITREVTKHRREIAR